MSTLASVTIYDIYSNLPTAGIPGRLFFVSTGANAGNAYYDTGSAWVQVATGGGGGGGGALVLLEEHTASASASLVFDGWYSSSYDDYLIEFLGLVSATSGGVLSMQVSSDGGSTYDTGSNYNTAATRWNSGGAGVSGGVSTQFDLSSTSDGLSNSGDYGVCGPCRLVLPASTAPYPRIVASLTYETSGSLFQGIETRGAYSGGSAINAFKLFDSAGNLASGTVRVYGFSM
jgi:hypothetical protein